MARKVTRELAEWAAGLTLGDVPEDVQRRAKLTLADITGIMVRARNDCESTPPLVDAIQAMGLAEGRFHAIGDSATYSSVGAALLNGTCAHSIELDDYHIRGGVHSSAPTAPAAFAGAELANTSGEDLLLGFIAGLEATHRIGLPLKGHWRPGFYSTPILGAYGAAVAAGKAMRLNADQIEHALGIVLSQAAGSGQFHVNGAWTKRFQVGNASPNGVIAASLARSGYTGAGEALEGHQGFFALMGENVEADRVVEELGTRWQLLDLAYKPHASCRGTHPAIDAAIALRAEHGLTLDQISDIEIRLGKLPYGLVGQPTERKRDPQNNVEGQFSVHYCVAVGLKLGRLAWDDYATQFRAPDVRALMQRTTAVLDLEREPKPRPGADPSEPPHESCIITMQTTDGRTVEKLITIPLGDPGNMLSEEDFRVKFNSLAERFLGAEGARELFDTLMNVEKEASAERIFALATPRVAVGAA
jgi:2-methylcitrate dehydratase PrpD